MVVRIKRFGDGSAAILCPACDEFHVFVRDMEGAADRPTFGDPVLIEVNATHHPEHNPVKPIEVCHFLIRDGRIEFLPESTHRLRGQTVALPVFDDQ